MSFKKLDLCKDKYFFAHLGMRMPFFAVAAIKNKLNIRLFHEYRVTNTYNQDSSETRSDTTVLTKT